MKNKKIIIALICVITAVIIGLLGFLYYQMNLQSVSDQSSSVEFEVIEGDSINTVIDRLDEQDLIKNASIAKFYAKINGLHNIKVGFFLLDPSWNTKEILEHVNNAENSGESGINITFREGIWAKDIAAALGDKTGIAKDEFIALWNDDEYLKTLINQYEFLTEDILNSAYRVKLEGYLFPETYSFPRGSDAKQITTIFLDHFDTIYQKHKADIDASGMSVQEVITFASMVQYEAKTATDMYKIAGVFKNRLNIDMTLGSSVTICYALYDDYKNAEDCEVNTTIDSPYNTYTNAGLPVGPILNPGETAIDAVLHPEANDFLYFMADIYGDGTVYYAKTQAEHDANVAKYLR